VEEASSLAQDQNEQVATTRGNAIEILALDEPRNVIVERLLLVGRFEGMSQSLAIGVADVFGDIAAQGALAEMAEAMPQVIEIAPGTHVLRGKGRPITEDIFVDEGREPVDFQQRILQRRGREENFFPFLKRVTDALTRLVAGPVAVAKFMRLVDDSEIERNTADFVLVAIGESVGANENFLRVERAWITVFFQFPISGSVENPTREMEFFLQFQGPLLADRSRADDKDASLLFRPQLAENQSGLDGFPQTDFVGENDAFGKRRLEGEQSGFDLVRIQIDLGVEERLRQAPNTLGVLQREGMGKVFGLVVDECHSSALKIDYLRRDFSEVLFPVAVVAFAVGLEVGVLVLEEGIGGDFAELGREPAHGEVHLGQLVGGGGELLPVNRDVFLAAVVAFDKLERLHEHAARAAAGVVDLAFVGLDHFGDEIDDALRGVELAPSLPSEAANLP